MAEGILVNDGRINIGGVAVLVAGDVVGILEGVTSYAKGVSANTRLLFRNDSTLALTEQTPAEIRVPTVQELSDRADAISLAAAQAIFDDAKTALDAAGGDSCTGCP